MQEDSISYVSTLGPDSLIGKDSVSRPVYSIGIIQGEISGVSSRLDTTSHTLSEKGKGVGREGVPHSFEIEQSDSVFGLLLLCFVLFAHIYKGGVSFLKRNISILFSSDNNKRIPRQTTAREIIYGYFLIFQTSVLTSVCVYDIFIQSEALLGKNETPLITIALFILFIGLFLGIKDCIYIMFGYIFDMNKLMNKLRRTYIIGIEMLGILYFIPILFLIYADYYHLQIVIFMLILFLIVQIILFYQIIAFFIREKFNFLYLIAYLCTFEILPYIFLIIGLAYLYRIDVFNIL